MQFVTTRLLAGLLAGTALFAPVVHADTVKVGVIASFSGPYATWGTQFRNAMDLYLEQHPQTAEGHDIELLYRDVGGNEPTRARQLAQELVVRDGVQYLIGLEFTPTMLATAEIANEAQIPVINLNSGTSSVTRASEFFTRLGFTQWQVGAYSGRYAVEEGNQKIVIISADYAPGVDAVESFRYGVTEAGGEVVEEILVPMGTTDFSSYLLRVQNAGADAAVMFMPVGPMSVGFMRGYVDRGLLASGIDLYVGAETQEIDLPALGEGAIGIKSVFTYSPYQDNPENVAFVEALLAKYGPEGLPNLAALAAWDGMGLIAHMIDSTDAQPDGVAAIDSIRGLEIASPRGPITIDPDTRDIIQNVYLRVVDKREDGVLYNRTLAVQEAVVDPWKEMNPE